MRIIADLHTHTTYSHGTGSVLDNVTAALTKGLQAVGITDHGPRSAPWVRATVRDLADMRRAVTDLDQRTIGIRILAGAECNITSLKGDLDVPSEVRQQLDIVLAGLHPGILPNTGRDWLALYGGNWAAKFNAGVRRRSRVANTRAVVEAVLRHDIDVITHPGYHLDIDTRELARACALRGTALEINARHHEMTVTFVRVAAQEGVKFVINSDAHNPADVGNLEHGIDVATAAGLTADQVINAEGGGLFDWLERRRVKRTARNGAGAGWRDWAEQPPLDKAGKERTDDRSSAGGGRSTWADWSTQGKIH